MQASVCVWWVLLDSLWDGDLDRLLTHKVKLFLNMKTLFCKDDLFSVRCFVGSPELRVC